MSCGIYAEDALKGKTPTEVADTIAAWRQDDDQMMDAAFDLLNAIEPWLREYKPPTIAAYNEQDWE